MSKDNEINSKTDYSKYIVPGLAGVAVAGAAAYGIVKNKKEKDSKDNNESLDNSEEESYII